VNRPDGTTRALGALAALAVAAFAYVTVETMPVGLLLSIATDLRTTPSSVGLLVSYYGLVVVVTTMPLTRFTSRIPRRRLLCALLAVFTVATALASVASSYRMLLAARLATALSQALFWAVVVPTAAALFSARFRARAIGVVFTGGSLAAVVGIPATTWLGQQAGWRAAFLAMAGIGAVVLVAMAVLLPGGGADTSTERAPAPDRQAYWALMALQALTVTGSFAMFTYVTAFLTGVARLPADVLGVVLLIRGVAGIAGVAVASPIADRRPVTAIVASVALQAVALLGLYADGGDATVAVIMVALTGFTFSVTTTAVNGRILHIAPGSVTMATAGASTAVNVGITTGALVGGLALPETGVRSIALIGGVFTLAGLGALAIRPGRRETAGEPIAV
jgi:DHA1 family inner membrane transport protein